MINKPLFITSVVGLFLALCGIILSLLSLSGSPVVPQRTQDPIVIVTEVRSERPEFHRIYTLPIEGGFTLKIEMKWFIHDRFDESELRQKDGKRIFFDAKNVADKIIDRELYPKVQRAVNQILEMDRKFIASNPSEYVDETGTRWRKVQ